MFANLLMGAHSNQEAEPNTFEILPDNPMSLIDEMRSKLEVLLEREAEPNFQSNFENMHRRDWTRKDKAEILAHLIFDEYNKQTPQPKFDAGFEAGLLRYMDGIFKDIKRDVELNGVSIYYMSHLFHTGMIASLFSGSPLTIYVGTTHDGPEQVLDTISSSVYASQDRLSELVNIRQKEFQEMVRSPLKYFPLAEDAPDRRNVAQNNREVYQVLKRKVLIAMMNEFRSLRKGFFVPAHEAYALTLCLDAITRMPGDPYSKDIARMNNPDTFISPFTLVEMPRTIEEDMLGFLEETSISSKLAKLIDGLHNFVTQDGLVIPTEIGGSSGAGKILDGRMKSTLKKIILIDYAKEDLMRKSVDYLLPLKYQGIYVTHLTMAHYVAQELSEIHKRVDEAYRSQELYDAGIKHIYGYEENERVSFGMLFDQIKDSIPHYEELGLFRKITSKHEKKEIEFYSQYKVPLAATIKKITDYAEKRKQTLYNNFQEEKNIVDLFKDTYSLERELWMYLGINSQGVFDPSLRDHHLLGLGSL
jgi:hypothetical protein